MFQEHSTTLDAMLQQKSEQYKFLYCSDKFASYE